MARVVSAMLPEGLAGEEALMAGDEHVGEGQQPREDVVRKGRPEPSSKKMPASSS